MMKLKGTLQKDGRWWIIECPALDAMTQGSSRREALEMMVDWVRTALDKPDFPVEIVAGKGLTFELLVRDPGPVLGLIVQRQRGASGMTLEQLASKLHLKSRSTAKHYERGSNAISVAKLIEILDATGAELEINVKRLA